jgi:serine/threonine protein kinase
MSEKKSKRKMKAPGLSIRTSEDKQPLNRSYSLTKSGVFQSDKGFKIDNKGIQESPAAFGSQRRQFIVNDLEELEIGAVIGHGAGGVVNRAVHKPTGMVVAVKSMDVLNDDTRRQMMRELKILYEHEGDHIVQFHGAFYDDCHINVVLEYMNAGSLADLFRRAGRFPESVISDFAAQIVQGLHYLHRERHQVHRDVKPANILCDQQGRVRLSDFGVAKDLTSTLEQCDTFLGTARYMAPETLGGKPYSYPADVWALGICLVEFATGRYPYDSFKSHWELLDAMQAQPLPHLPDDGEYSEEFRDFVRRCLQVDPDARGQIGELAEHAFVNQTLSAIMKQQTVDWIREQIERYAASKAQRRSGGGAEAVAAAKEVLEEVGEDYDEESFEEYQPSPHASTSPDGLQVEFPFHIGDPEASDDLVQFDMAAGGMMQPEPQPDGAEDEDFQPVLHPRSARRGAAVAAVARSSDIDELMQSKEGLYALRASLEVLDMESDVTATTAAGVTAAVAAEPPSAARTQGQPAAASHPLNSMRLNDELEVDVGEEEVDDEEEVVESCLSPTPAVDAEDDDHELLPERVSIPPTQVMMSPAMPRSRGSSREVRPVPAWQEEDKKQSLLQPPASSPNTCMPITAIYSIGLEPPCLHLTTDHI